MTQRRRFAALVTAVAVTPLGLQACSGSSGSPSARVSGQSNFISAPFPGNGGAERNAASGGAPTAAADAGATYDSSSTTNRTVEETDLYRLEGDRLYYLNAYRGLMVFDVADINHPRLLGRAPIFGSPVEMLVRNGVATVVVADWYGALDDGSPFHGSIVRGFDATDPANIRTLGDAKLGGWVRDLRVVGDVLYAVSQQWDETYGWWGGMGGGVVGVGGISTSKTVVSSVSFAGGVIRAIGEKEYQGWGGVFNVTPQSILLAHDGAQAGGPYGYATTTELQYLDISDPGGAITARGAIDVHGRAQGWGADNGRWNLDFADGKLAHVVGCANGECGGSNGSYVLATADFTNPDAPTLRSELSIPSTGWLVSARFDSGRMYLVPGNYSYYGTTATTPFQVYDLTSPDAPKLAGSAEIPGSVWLMVPSNNRIFALGSDDSNMSSKVSLKYLDVSDPAKPALLGTSTFGDGWAWTPAASTFKAFTKDEAQGLVVLPFSGWSSSSGQYVDGTQLIEFTPTTIRTAGAAKTRGWVERGIFVKGRIVALSDLALSVIDYTNHDAPAVVAELTLARNVIAAQPHGDTVAQIASDWWGNDKSHSEVRVLPISNAEESREEPNALSLQLDGVGARVFRNGDLAYVVSSVPVNENCTNGKGCYAQAYQDRIQVVDLSNGGAKLRGSVSLPVPPNYYGYGYGYGGWYGYYWYDWFDGAGAVQVGKDALVFRRWQPNYSTDGVYVDALQSLFVVDLSNPDAPQLASTVVTQDPTGWWGNLKVVGSTLYASHYEWVPSESPDAGDGGAATSAYGSVRYYLDRVDLSDRAHPRIGAKINVPGVLVGGSETDPSLLYTIDYRWYGEDRPRNDFDVLKLEGDVAYLQSTTPIDGWVGNVFVRGNTAWTSAQQYYWTARDGQPKVQLHQIDIVDASHPVDHAATSDGWGWLLGVEEDRAILTSGWAGQGIDLYRLAPNTAPTFDRFVRTQGWSVASVARQGNQLFLASGYWGVQVVNLQ